MEGLNLSVVVIGRNEEKNIVRCIKSITSALDNYKNHEVIYVDSNSDDKTVEYIRKFDVSIYTIDGGERMTASKGRYVGAINSTKKYILFLDADMELQKGWVERALDTISRKDDVAGIMGIRNDIIISWGKIATIRRNCYGTTHLEETKHFGGAVLFKRNDLMLAGNYAPNVIANEEAELHSRLTKIKKVVLEHPVDMINHYVPLEKTKRNIKNMLISKRNLGIGQGFVNSIYSKSILYFIVRFKHLFFSMLLDLISLFFFVALIISPSCKEAMVILAVQLASLSINVVFKKWYYYLIDKVSSLYFLPGILTYKHQKVIKYKKIQ